MGRKLLLHPGHLVLVKLYNPYENIYSSFDVKRGQLETSFTEKHRALNSVALKSVFLSFLSFSL